MNNLGIKAFTAAASMGFIWYAGLYRAKQENPSATSGCPQIGDKVSKMIHGQVKNYFVFGATGHSLATCKQIERNCEQKTHNDLLFYMPMQSGVYLADNYARCNVKSDSTDPNDTIPAVAYLGIDKSNHITRRESLGPLGPTELNKKDPDVQVVYIRTIEKSAL